MAQENNALDSLKAKMSNAQREDMAKLIAQEMRRRGIDQKSEKVNSTQDALRRSKPTPGAVQRQAYDGLYSDVQARLSARRQKPKSASERNTEKRATRRSSEGFKNMMQAGSSLIKQNARKKNFVIAGAIVLLALVKVFSAATPSKPAGVTFTDARASLNSASDVAGVENMGAILPAANPQANNAENAANTAPTAITSEPVTALPERIDRRMVSWSQTEKEVLTALDARRVELEKRKQLLDSREAELKVQSATLQERMAELRALTQQAAQLRKATDSQQRARIEQLANVYGSMAPNEAAPLFARLDESIALALLRHMPGKRIGQILSVMDRDRAVHLTKVLSEEGTLSTEGAER